MRRDIPREEWNSTLESFTLQHDHWLVTVDTEMKAAGPPISDEPLEGLVARSNENRDEIVITVGASTKEHRRVTVDDPKTIAIESENGVDREVRIEDHAGQVTRVRLKAPIAPELVDGIV